MINKRKIIESLAYWSLPPGVQHYLRMAYKKIVNPPKSIKNSLGEVSLIAQKNATLMNKHKDQRCFILATGPSIKHQNLSLLKNDICIAVSQFFLHHDVKIISPIYHVLAPSHHPFKFDELKKIFNGFNLYYDEEVTYFYGHSPYQYSVSNFLLNYPQYHQKKEYFIDYSNSQPLNEDNYLNSNVWDISKNPFQIRTVVYIAIQLAIFMGFKKIYLLGCDHDYLNDTSRVTNHHFYKEEDGISDVKHLSSFTTERWFEEYYFRWKQYRLMKEYAQTVNCQIFNATKGGMLDVFPRVELESLF